MKTRRSEGGMITRGVRSPCLPLRNAGKLIYRRNLFLSSTKWPRQLRRQHNLAMFPLSRRNIGFIKVISRAGKIPTYIGGTMAAGGSYVMYKVEQATNYTQDKVSAFKDIANGIFENTGEFFRSNSGKSDVLEAPGNSNGREGNDGSGDGDGDSTNTVGVSMAALGLSSEESSDADIEDDDSEETLVEDDDDFDVENDETGDQIMNLTRQMIEIRNILSRIESTDSVNLPLIVVIGSQSSGKSSVLESIVGQEFLPKGLNMVTRRPVELTLVNTPESASETAEFPALRIHNLGNFEQVQKILFDLNMAVPSSECISNDPIQITIKSPRVPDLSLVDLPGYIQIEAADQPPELKQKIKSLCNKYLEAPNIILAISAADVDLANSAALRASRASDPRGERTIGVITKLDLVDPERAREVLTNKKYPLRMGYVGIITKSPLKKNSSLFSRKSVSGYQAYVAQQNFERNYLKEHKDVFLGTTTGTRNLKMKLMKVLEKSMAASLKPTQISIQQDLEETSYQFKVEFNDRPLTAQTYLANNVDLLKLSTKDLSHKFSRNELKALLKFELDQRVLNLLAERYWNHNYSSQTNTAEPHVSELSVLANIPEDSYWQRNLDLSANALTKLGIGRTSTGLITGALLTEVDNMVNCIPLLNHPNARNAVLEAAKTVLGAKYYSTADQVENCIKPYKYEIEIEDREWLSSRENALKLLKEEIRQCDEAYNDLRRQAGGKKLQQVVTYLKKLNQLNGQSDKNANETLGFSNILLLKGREAMFLSDRSSILKMRYQFLGNSKKCKRKENKYYCPEIFLDAISTKLTSTAVLFLNVELLSDFYYNFPRELDIKFFNNMSTEEIESFAREDPKIRKHIELQERKDLLENALQKMDSILALQRSKISVIGKNAQERTKDSVFSWVS